MQQLTEAENEVVESQKREIEALKEELVRAKSGGGEMYAMDGDYNLVVTASSSFGSCESEQPSSYCFAENQRLAERASLAELQQVNADVKKDVDELEASKCRITEEIDTLKQQVKTLVEERTTLIKEVEVYSHVSEMAEELEESQMIRAKLELQIKELTQRLEELLSERDAALEKAETENMIREEMQKEMKALYEEKIVVDTQLADLQRGGGGGCNLRGLSSNTPSVASSVYEADIQLLKKEIDVIRAENESLRVTAKREAATIQGLNDEIRSLSAENVSIKRSASSSLCDDPLSRKRALALSQGSVGDDDHHTREYKRSIGYEPNRERLGSTGSCNSASYESDNVSVLFGQDSIAGGSKNSDDKSDHHDIRAHAEKLLYWATKSAERRKVTSSSSSGSQVLTRQYTVPATIGLPPRAGQQTNKMKKINGPSLLPPRPPSSVQYDEDRAGSVGDKENGTAFNILSRGKTNKGVSEKAVIFNLDQVQSQDSSCQCSVSPFSGNDPHAEFYLPKLGLACTCGQTSVVEDREAFAKSPTSLRNILREWQCDFLQSLHIYTADQFLRAHKAGANDMARSMKKWRVSNNMESVRSKECYVALTVWSRTAKVVLRSIKNQQAIGRSIEKPSFLDISFADAHTVCSVSTLGQLSSVGGGRVNEMMEI